MSEVWQEEKGFHSAMGASRNKHIGYRSVRSDFWNIGRGHRCNDSVIGQEHMVYRSGMSKMTVINKAVAAVWFT